MERDWIHLEQYTSTYGIVYKVLGGEWQGKVNLGDGKQARLSETYVSADVAKGAVKRTWEREQKKRNLEV